jgi:hypothetical protein
MAAEIVPFPAHRRGRFVAKQAARMADLSPAAAERHLQQQLKIQGDTMARRGISEDLITEQRSRLEKAIRTDLWRLVLCPGDEA